MDQSYAPLLLIGAVLLLMLWPMIRMRLAGIPRITVSDLKVKLDRREEMLLLDVRTSGEFKGGGHIAGALNVPVDELGGRLASVKEKAARKPVVVICQMGPRAARAAMMLKGAVPGPVSVVQGGMNGWAAAGLPMKRG